MTLPSHQVGAINLPSFSISTAQAILEVCQKRGSDSHTQHKRKICADAPMLQSHSRRLVYCTIPDRSSQSSPQISPINHNEYVVPIPGLATINAAGGCLVHGARSADADAVVTVYYTLSIDRRAPCGYPSPASLASFAQSVIGFGKEPDVDGMRRVVFYAWSLWGGGGGGRYGWLWSPWGQITTSYPKPCVYYIFIPQTTESYPLSKNEVWFGNLSKVGVWFGNFSFWCRV